MATAVISTGCTNCVRFVDALKRTKTAAERVRLVDVATLDESQRTGLTAVPTLILGDGRRLVGTDAFQWLDQFAAEVEPDAFGGFGALPFSDITADIGFATFSDPYTAIE